MDAVGQFAMAAAAFRDWARGGTDTGEAAALAALRHITRLYLAGLELPAGPWEPGADDGLRVGDDEWNAVQVTAAARLPLDWYAVVCDPLTVPPEVEAGIGSLSDDIADIYRDVVVGLREYDAGRREPAVWQWKFWLARHWGQHATEAIAALHAWLSANAEFE